uniref:Uncharacterized protein n=1 Tax=Opuntia streptacantha TaxID=393608 RepID=A0A7C9D284_OPUST
MIALLLLICVSRTSMNGVGISKEVLLKMSEKQLRVRSLRKTSSTKVPLLRAPKLDLLMLLVLLNGLSLGMLLKILTLRYTWNVGVICLLIGVELKRRWMHQAKITVPAKVQGRQSKGTTRIML